MNRLFQPQKWEPIYRVLAVVAVILGVLTGGATVIGWTSGFFSQGDGSTNASVTATAAAQLTQSATTSSLTPTATATLAPTIPPTAPPTPCQPGAVCYRADWSKGIDAWGAGSEWAVSNGLLINSGTDHNNCSVSPTLTLPFQPTTSNYSVQVQVRWPNGSPGNIAEGCFGISARLGAGTGYVAYWQNQGVTIASDARPLNFTCCSTLGSDWHTLSFDVNGPNLALKVDGGVRLSTNDAAYLTVNGQIGLSDYYDLIYIRSIVVKGL
jgi:hypothetical protein